MRGPMRIPIVVSASFFSILAFAACGARTDLEDGGRPDVAARPSPDDLLRAATFVASCSRFAQVGTDLYFLSQDPSTDPAWVACIVQHHDGCAALDACPRPLQSAPFPGCSATQGQAFLCGDGGWASCFDGVGEVERCVGGTVCSDQTMIPVLGGVGCVGTGPACALPSNDLTDGAFGTTVGCDDQDTVRRCQNGFEATTACGDLAEGWMCQQTPSGVGDPFFCGTAMDCDPITTAATCEGTAVVACLGGALTQLDCTSLGFSGCANGFCF
jgi:hypothetical protein